MSATSTMTTPQWSRLCRAATASHLDACLQRNSSRGMLAKPAVLQAVVEFVLYPRSSSDVDDDDDDDSGDDE